MRHLWLGLLALLVGSEALAMRCGKQLIANGMNRIQVLERCGEPDDRNRRFEIVHRRINKLETVSREIEIEEWYYQRGSRDLARRLVFIDGRMVREEIPGPSDVNRF